MSTFDGRLAEFPEIRIDFFRRHPDVQPPLACFLSHVHSDHLQGLESLRSPFVYCSAATKEILLRLEKYPCRINYAKGVLEARQQTYKHLAKILKPLPLGAPTVLELQPGSEIRVTLFDANHCPGAVMFLIERPGTAILYTGDIRSEPWFVTSLVRNPNLIGYACGVNRIDKIYLDTSFTRNISFQTKAQGLVELVQKVSAYPKDTVFHFQAWTFGYEEVWTALAAALGSKVHVDEYKLKIYESLGGPRVWQSESSSRSFAHGALCPEVEPLVGHVVGNKYQPGCLTSNPNVRIHSCERGNMCSVAKDSNVVRIQPVVAHVSQGNDLPEMGIGGGGDDLEREPELSLDEGNVEAFLSKVQELTQDPGVREALLIYLQDAGNKLPLDMNVSLFDGRQSATLEKIMPAVLARVKSSRDGKASPTAADNAPLPKTIRFPYSRHSSYEELCQLVEAFRPTDIWPCTYNPQQWHEAGKSISSLFGRYCTGKTFAHDEITKAFADRRADEEFLAKQLSQRESTQDTTLSSAACPLSAAEALREEDASLTRPEATCTHAVPAKKRAFSDYTVDADDTSAGDPGPTQEQATSRCGPGDVSDRSAPEAGSEGIRRRRRLDCSYVTDRSPAEREAYIRILEYMRTGEGTPVELISTGNNHSLEEREL